MKQHSIPCKDNCSILKFVQYEDEDDFYIGFYINYFPRKKKLIKRVWDAIRNKSYSTMDIVCTKEDMDNLKQFLEDGIQ